MRYLLLLVSLYSILGTSKSLYSAEELNTSEEEALVVTDGAGGRAQYGVKSESDSVGPQVRLVGSKTDVAKRYRAIIPPLPFPPFTTWRKWFKDHENSVHCGLEWRDEQCRWFHGELRSTHFDLKAEPYRVGWGEFPGTAYDAYGIYISPGRMPRDKDVHGKPVEITVDEVLDCDYKLLEREIRKYGAKYARSGDVGTGGIGQHNVGLGGPAYKASQNSNTMVNYVLRACGVIHKAPDLAVGWHSEPHFPYSSNADAPALDNRP